MKKYLLLILLLILSMMYGVPDSCFGQSRLWTRVPVSVPPTFATIYDTISVQGRDAARSEGSDTEDTTDMRVYYAVSLASSYDAGFQFTLAIPQGKTIDSAFISLRTGSLLNISGSDDTLKVLVAAVDNSTRFDGTHSSVRAHESAWVADSVRWNDAWGEYTVFSTPNLKTLVQAVVGRAGWVSGNYMTFLLARQAGGEYSRFTFADSQNGTAGYRPRIRVTYH